jgi:hypothetical protein
MHILLMLIRVFSLLIYYTEANCTASRVAQSSIVTGFGLGDWGSIPDEGRGFFSVPSASSRLWGPTQPPVQWIPGTFPGVNAAGA